MSSEKENNAKLCYELTLRNKFAKYLFYYFERRQYV